MAAPTDLRQHYLAALGVDVYVRRAATSVAFASVAGRVAALFAVDQQALADTRYQALFSDIAQALGAKAAVLRWSDAPAVDAAAPQLIVNFGGVAMGSASACEEIRLADPARLSASAGAKRNAWNALKAVLRAAHAEGKSA